MTITRIGRHDSHRTPPGTIVPAYADGIRGSVAFDASLRDSRRREESRRAEPRKPHDEKPSGSGSRSPSVRTAQTEHRAHAPQISMSAALSQLVGEEQHARQSPRKISVPPQSPSGAAAAQQPKRHRAADSATMAPCLEITLANTGTRLVLSRQADVWLLSIQSETPLTPAQFEEFKTMLRAQFAQRNLGAVDIMLV